jgi:hypothetical protein
MTDESIRAEPRVSDPLAALLDRPLGELIRSLLASILTYMAQTILSVVAIVISVFAAGSQFLQWYLEGRRVSVNSRTSLLVGTPNGPRSVLILSATNHGRIPATIRQWGFDSPDDIYRALAGPGNWSQGPDMPFVLEPGVTQSWQLDYREQKEQIGSYHPDSPYLLRGFVRLGTGKRRLSSSFVQLGTGPTRLTNPQRWRLRRVQRNAGPAAFVVGKKDPDRFYLTLQRPKLCLYTKKFIIDVVVCSIAPGASTPARTLQNHRSACRFWFRRKVMIEVPEDLLDMADAWYRIRWRDRRRPHEQRIGTPSRDDLAHLHATTFSPSS